MAMTSLKRQGLKTEISLHVQFRGGRGDRLCVEEGKGQRAGSAVKRECYSCTEPEFGSGYPS